MAVDLDEVRTGPSGSDQAKVLMYEPPTAEAADSKTRRFVSYLLFALLTAVVVAAFVQLFGINDRDLPTNSATAQLLNAQVADAEADADRLMGLMNVVFGPVVTLFSSVVGFYFGARTAKESSGNG